MIKSNKLNTLLSKISAAIHMGDYVDPKFAHCSVYTDKRGKMRFNHALDCLNGKGYKLKRSGNTMNIKTNMLVAFGELRFRVNTDFDCAIESEDGHTLGAITKVNTVSPYGAKVDGKETVVTLSDKTENELLKVIQHGLRGKDYTTERAS